MEIKGVESGSEFEKTLRKHLHIADDLKKKVAEFLAQKQKNPNQQVGVDTPLTHKFSDQIPGLMHVRLTGDLRLIYVIRGNYIYVIGVYGHDEIGTNKDSGSSMQDQAIARWKTILNNLKDEPAVAEYKPEIKERPPEREKVRDNPIYKQEILKPTLALTREFTKVIDELDGSQPSRDLKRKVYTAVSKDAMRAILLREFLAFDDVKKTRKLHPAEQKYITVVQQLADILQKQPSLFIEQPKKSTPRR